jgi:hypothetical protein
MNQVDWFNRNVYVLIAFGSLIISVHEYQSIPQLNQDE